MGARPSGRFSGNEPMRLEFSESCGRSDSEAASTPRSDTDNLWMHGTPCPVDSGLDACPLQTYPFTLMAPRQRIPNGRRDAGLLHRKD